MKVNIIDLHFLGHSNTIASFLIESKQGLILIETGPYSTLPTLKKGINKLGYDIKDIKHVFLTHIHFDHAGASWYFAEKRAKIYMHPLGTPHMEDPSKLIASATRIYGDQMDTLWGLIKPIEKNTIHSLENEEIIDFEDFQIKAFYTPGHASHHIIYQFGDKIICGDVAGVKILDGNVVPPCPPPDINIEKWTDSLQLIKQLNPKTILLTHFGEITTNIEEHLENLKSELMIWADWIEVKYKAEIPPQDVVDDFMTFCHNRQRNKGLSKELIAKYEKSNPSWMSVYGLYRYFKKKNRMLS